MSSSSDRDRAESSVPSSRFRSGDDWSSYSPTGPARRVRPADGFDLLVQVLLRCAAVGRLRVEPRVAARLILAANVGLALTSLGEADQAADPSLASRMQSIVFGSILTDVVVPTANDPLALAADQLSAQLVLHGTDALSTEELALLQLWLTRLADSDRTQPD